MKMQTIFSALPLLLLYLLNCEVVSSLHSSTFRQKRCENNHGLQLKIGKMYKIDGGEKIFE